MKWSVIPVICSTADTSPSATRPCPRTIASGFSLIVFGEVLPHVGGGAHASYETLVERFGGIYPAEAQEMIHGDDFRHNGDVLPRVERDGDARDLHVENLRGRSVEPRAIRRLRVLPVLEPHHHLDALLLTHGAHSE